MDICDGLVMLDKRKICQHDAGGYNIDQTGDLRFTAVRELTNVFIGGLLGVRLRRRRAHKKLGACRTCPARLRKTIYWLEFSGIFVSYGLIASENCEKFQLKSRFPRLHASSPTGS